MEIELTERQAKRYIKKGNLFEVIATLQMCLNHEKEIDREIKFNTEAEVERMTFLNKRNDLRLSEIEIHRYVAHKRIVARREK